MSSRRVAVSGGVLRRDFKEWPWKINLGRWPLLRGEQFADAGLAEREKFGEMRFTERGFFAAALQFNEFTGGIHHEVHVYRRRDILGVAQIQQCNAFTMPTLAAATGFKSGFSTSFFSASNLLTASASATKFRDGRRARAAVRLQHVAVNAHVRERFFPGQSPRAWNDR